MEKEEGEGEGARRGKRRRQIESYQRRKRNQKGQIKKSGKIMKIGEEGEWGKNFCLFVFYSSFSFSYFLSCSSSLRTLPAVYSIMYSRI